MDEFLPIQQHFTVPVYVNRGVSFIRGEGMYLYDTEGTRYLDLMSNYGVSILGHSHPDLMRALTQQLSRLVTLHGSFGNDSRANAAKMLIKRCGSGLKQVYFSNSGAEAIEAALKFAVLASGKKRFIVAEHGYHGKTLGALSATSGEKYSAPFTPLLWQFDRIPFGNITSLSETISPETAAVILEPVQGEGGIYPPPAEYLQAVRELCTKNGILLIIDEIQTGCGRTGTFLAIQQHNVNPDILCLGKGLAGGIPVGATLVTTPIGEQIPRHIHTSTFGGNPLACAGIIATLELLNEPLLDHVVTMGTYFIHALKMISSPLISDVRGVGLMIGIELTSQRDEILKKMQKEQILAIPAGASVIRFLPPFLIQKREIDSAVATLKRILV